MQNINSESLLSELGLKHIDTVLAERFLLPVDSLTRFGMKVPTKVSDIVELSGMPISRVQEILHECIELNKSIYWSRDIDEFFTSNPESWLLDVRPGVSIEQDPLHPRARIFHHGNQAAQIELMKSMSEVLVISDPESHAWSAAMALRQMGINAKVFCC